MINHYSCLPISPIFLLSPRLKGERKCLVLSREEVVSRAAAAAAGCGDESWGVTDVNNVVCEAIILWLLLLILFSLLFVLESPIRNTGARLERATGELGELVVR